MFVRYVTGICAIVAVSVAFGGGAIAADKYLRKGEYDCHDKETKMVGVCKNLGRGFCSFTADATTVKMRCTDVRR